MTTLHAISTEVQIAIVVVHHQRKMGADEMIDTVSGTLGLTGGVDNVIVQGKDEGTMYLWGNGREIRAKNMIAVEFDKAMRLQNVGQIIEGAETRERAAIVAVLAKANPKYPLNLEQYDQGGWRQKGKRRATTQETV